MAFIIERSKENLEGIQRISEVYSKRESKRILIGPNHMVKRLALAKKKFTLFQHTQWTEWNQCSSPCNGGFTSRSRRCFSSHCFNQTTHVRQYQMCNVNPCREIRIYGDWTNWLTTEAGLTARYQARCEANVPNGSFLKASLRKSKNKIQEWLNWEDWSSCSSTCGYGIRTRWRRVANLYPTNGTLSHESQVCSVPPCDAEKLVEWTDMRGSRWRMLKCSEYQTCFDLLANENYEAGRIPLKLGKR
ncbi:unnamed protein product [Dracunculus medinensis]|uniref:TSP1_spondin domain-containing protein n=1 Tax=Dracunculus medinensis TaxID=318479 RepID=A0A0N4UE21_DRAME|nr:unnamed protein product [Dracunculus medinensis]